MKITKYHAIIVQRYATNSEYVNKIGSLHVACTLQHLAVQRIYPIGYTLHATVHVSDLWLDKFKTSDKQCWEGQEGY